MLDNEIKKLIVELSRKNGFIAAGVVDQKLLKNGLPLYEKWINETNPHYFPYLMRDYENRFKIASPFKSIVSFAIPYYHPKILYKNDKLSNYISLYAQGLDYHYVVKEKLNTIGNELKKNYPSIEFLSSVDSGNLAERSMAVAAGIGSIGKNGCLFVSGAGSFVFIGELLLNIELDPDSIKEDKLKCNNCSICIESCPTKAFLDDGYAIDPYKCISYWTVESKGLEFPENIIKSSGYSVFGCDICQINCPQNENILEGVDSFKTFKQWQELSTNEISSITGNQWKKITASSSLKRVSVKKIAYNLKIITK